MHKVFLFILVVFIFYSCQQKQTNSENQQQTEVDNQKVKKSFDSLKMATISIEGSNEEIQLRLYDQRNDLYPFNFYTYYPDNFTVSNASADEGDGFVFTMNEAKLSLTILSKQSAQNIDHVGNWAKQMLQASGAVDIRKIDDVWHAHSKDKIFHIEGHKSPEGYFYYWYAQYPYEYADGFGPRIAIIKREFTIVEQ